MAWERSRAVQEPAPLGGNHSSCGRGREVWRAPSAGVPGGRAGAPGGGGGRAGAAALATRGRRRVARRGAAAGPALRARGCRLLAAAASFDGVLARPLLQALALQRVLARQARHCPPPRRCQKLVVLAGRVRGLVPHEGLLSRSTCAVRRPSGLRRAAVLAVGRAVLRRPGLCSAGRVGEGCGVCTQLLPYLRAAMGSPARAVDRAERVAGALPAAWFPPEGPPRDAEGFAQLLQALAAQLEQQRGARLPGDAALARRLAAVLAKTGAAQAAERLTAAYSKA